MNVRKFLIVLSGLILLAAIVYSGIEIVNSYAASANRDQLVSTLYDLGTTAKKYFDEHAAKGGGGNSFKGWKLPASFHKTEYGSIAAVTHVKRVDICGTGTQIGRNGFTLVRVTARIDSVGVVVTIVN